MTGCKSCDLYPVFLNGADREIINTKKDIGQTKNQEQHHCIQMEIQKAFNYAFSAWVSLYGKKNIPCEIGDYSVSKDLLIVGRGSMVRMHKWRSQRQIHKSRCLNSASLWKHKGVYVLSFYAILTPTDGSYVLYIHR